MQNRLFPTLDQHRWPRLETVMDGPVNGIGSCSPLVSSIAAPAAFGKPVSSMMERNMWTVDAEDMVEEVEQILARQGLASIPVVGSNGAIVGIIGPQELARFFSEKGNAKAVRAWEISRCTTFEVGPDDSIEDVAKLMAEKTIEYIAVTELGVLKGVVSALNLLQAVLPRNIVETVPAAQVARAGAGN